MLSAVLIILTSFIAPSFQFIAQKHSNAVVAPRMLMSSTAIFPTTDSDVLTIRVAAGDELPRCAGFLSSSMYPSTVPKGEYECFLTFHNMIDFISVCVES